MKISRSILCIRCLLITALIVIVGAGAYLVSGLYSIGADTPHNGFTYWVLDTLRESAVERASSDITVPADLDTPERLLAGGADYNEMCAGCHLKPGLTESDFSVGLYPSPPDLTADHDEDGESEGDAALLREHFWIIKHGIKASGMPAWGYGHDDNRIWNMVAFIKRLPELSPQQYQILTARRQSHDDD